MPAPSPSRRPVGRLLCSAARRAALRRCRCRATRAFPDPLHARPQYFNCAPKICTRLTARHHGDALREHGVAVLVGPYTSAECRSPARDRTPAVRPVDLLVARRARACWRQPASGARDRGLHVLRRRVDFAIQRELHRDRCGSQRIAGVIESTPAIVENFASTRRGQRNWTPWSPDSRRGTERGSPESSDSLRWAAPRQPRGTRCPQTAAEKARAARVITGPLD